MKKIFYVITLIISCVIITSCGTYNNDGNFVLSSINPNEESERISDTTQNTTQNTTQSNTPSTTCIPTATTNIVESTPSKTPNQASYFGKWKITEMVGYGYIYGEFSMDDYINGIITINENYIESDIPLGKERLEHPKYKVTTQGKDEFFIYRHANFDNGFGFKGDKVKSVMVYDGNDKWGGYVDIFWIRDKNHLIFMGPVYFLAERVE